MNKISNSVGLTFFLLHWPVLFLWVYFFDVDSCFKTKILNISFIVEYLSGTVSKNLSGILRKPVPSSKSTEFKLCTRYYTSISCAFTNITNTWLYIYITVNCGKQLIFAEFSFVFEPHDKIPSHISLSHNNLFNSYMIKVQKTFIKVLFLY